MSTQKPDRHLDLAEIVPMVEPAGKRILEIGCGDGALGRAFLAAGALQVVGVASEVSATARQGLTAVFKAGSDVVPQLPYPDGYFDIVTFVNVLESVDDPARLIGSARRYVRDGGHVVGIVENARHESVVLPLLFKGEMQRESARFFTRSELERVLLTAGFEMSNVAAQTTEPSKTLPIMTELVASAGGNAQLFAEEAVATHLIFAARPSNALGAAPADVPNLWVTAKTDERVMFLAGGNPEWEVALAKVVNAYAKTGKATIGLPLRANDLQSPPPALLKIIGDDVDAVLMEAPTDDNGWARLVAGSTSVAIGKGQTMLRNVARTVGTPIIETTDRRVSPNAHFASPIALTDDKARYLDLMKRVLTNVIYSDADVQFDSAYDLDRRAGGLDWPEKAHTMVGMKRLDNLQALIEDVIKKGVPGDVIETGVWRGGATILMRAILAAYGVRDRRVWVADSFEGLPPPNAELYPADAGDKHFTKKELAVSLEDVKHHFDVYGLLDEQVKFLKGWFKDTLHVAPIEKLAVVRLDGDMYESTMDGIRALYPKLSVGGYLIVDDFHAVAGCRKAIEDYRKEHGITDEIKPIDRLAVYWQRTK
jgi:O-methyltransferase